MINITGQFFDTSGYASHTRGLANALNKLTKVKLTTNLMPGWEKLVNDKELEMIKRKPEKDEINLIIAMPHQWKLLKGKRNFAYCVWEGDKVPESFLLDFNDEDIEYIFVPSEHTKRAIEKTLDEIVYVSEKIIQNEQILKKIKVISHGVNLSEFYPKEKPKDKFVFIANKGFRNMEDRGGIQYLLQAYLEEFTISDNVELFLKLNPAYGVMNIEQAIKELSPHTKTNSGPIVKINMDNLPYNRLVDIYNQGHVFVSPTRSDAFNLPCLEAMACGLPVISTTFGGQTDFIKENNNGWLIGGDLKEVEHEIMYEGIKWLTPDVVQLKKVMRMAYNSQKLVKELGQNAIKTAKEFTWENSAKKIVNLI